MSQPEKSKQTLIHTQEKTQSWRYGYHKIGVAAVAEYTEGFSESDQSAYP